MNVRIEQNISNNSKNSRREGREGTSEYEKTVRIKPSGSNFNVSFSQTDLPLTQPVNQRNLKI